MLLFFFFLRNCSLLSIFPSLCKPFGLFNILNQFVFNVIHISMFSIFHSSLPFFLLPYPLLSSHLLSLLALLFPSLLGWSVFLSGFGWAKHGSRRGGGSSAEPRLGSLLRNQLPMEWSSPSPAPTPARQPERWSTWQYRLPRRSRRYSSRGRGLLGGAGREARLVTWPLNTGRALCCANTCALLLAKLWSPHIPAWVCGWRICSQLNSHLSIFFPPFTFICPLTGTSAKIANEMNIKGMLAILAELLVKRAFFEFLRNASLSLDRGLCK